jgi:hypothetical protein
MSWGVGVGEGCQGGDCVEGVDDGGDDQVVQSKSKKTKERKKTS